MNVDWKKTSRTLLVFAFALGLASCSGGEQTTTAAAESDPLSGFVPAVSATGVVRPSTWATLSFQGGGLVEEVLVERGDQVEAGQILVELGGTEQVRASLTAARLEQVSAQQALDTLIENGDLAAAQAQLVLALARDALEDAEYDWQVLQPGYRASGDTIDAAEANLVLANEEVDRAQQVYDHASGEAGKALGDMQKSLGK